MDKLEYVDGMYYNISITKKDLTALRKRFTINKDGQSGTTSSGFEISGYKTSLSGKGLIWKTVVKVLNEVRKEDVKLLEKKMLGVEISLSNWDRSWDDGGDIVTVNLPNKSVKFSVDSEEGQYFIKKYELQKYYPIKNSQI